MNTNPQDNLVFLCQDYADYESATGDSGGPVFFLDFDGTVQLLGLHSQTTDDGQFSVISSMLGIQDDLGWMVTY